MDKVRDYILDNINNFGKVQITQYTVDKSQLSISYRFAPEEGKDRFIDYVIFSKYLDDEKFTMRYCYNVRKNKKVEWLVENNVEAGNQLKNSLFFMEKRVKDLLKDVSLSDWYDKETKEFVFTPNSDRSNMSVLSFKYLYKKAYGVYFPNKVNIYDTLDTKSNKRVLEIYKTVYDEDYDKYRDSSYVLELDLNDNDLGK